LEYSIKAIDTVVPNIEGNIDDIKSQLPQHPKGTSEKNEKKELNTAVVLPVVALLLSNRSLLLIRL
jgi:hypothetical protein